MKKDFFCLYSKGLLKDGDIIIDQNSTVFETKTDLREFVRTVLEYIYEEYDIVRFNVDKTFVSLKHGLLRIDSGAKVIDVMPCYLDDERFQKIQRIFGRMKKK